MIRLPAPVGFGTTKWLGFLCLTSAFLKPRIWLFFLTKEQCYLSVEDDKKIRKKRGLYAEQSQEDGIKF